MNIIVAEKSESTNIIVDGNIEVLNFKNFKIKLTSIVNNSSKDVMIDLINMDYISSSTIGDLLNIKKLLEKKGKKLIFNNISAPIVKSLSCCRLLNDII